MTASDLASLPRVVAFEPDPNSYAMLGDAAAVVLNHTFTGRMAAIPPERLTLVNAAVGKAEGTARFTSSRGGSGGSNGLSLAGGVVVRVVRLDEELPKLGLHGRVHLVKSDLEGFDPDAIYGAEGLLRRNAIDLWYYEYHGKVAQQVNAHSACIVYAHVFSHAHLIGSTTTPRTTTSRSGMS